MGNPNNSHSFGFLVVLQITTHVLGQCGCCSSNNFRYTDQSLRRSDVESPRNPKTSNLKGTNPASFFSDLLEPHEGLKVFLVGPSNRTRPPLPILFVLCNRTPAIFHLLFASFPRLRRDEIKPIGLMDSGQITIAISEKNPTRIYSESHATSSPFWGPCERNSKSLCFYFYFFYITNNKLQISVDMVGGKGIRWFDIYIYIEIMGRTKNFRETIRRGFWWSSRGWVEWQRERRWIREHGRESLGNFCQTQIQRAILCVWKRNRIGQFQIYWILLI